MNNEQEYYEFWQEVMQKVKEIEKKYSELSKENQQRVDSVKETVMCAHTYHDAIQILLSQSK